MASFRIPDFDSEQIKASPIPGSSFVHSALELKDTLKSEMHAEFKKAKESFQTEFQKGQHSSHQLQQTLHGGVVSLNESINNACNIENVKNEDPAHADTLADTLKRVSDTTGGEPNVKFPMTRTLSIRILNGFEAASRAGSATYQTGRNFLSQAAAIGSDTAPIRALAALKDLLQSEIHSGFQAFQSSSRTFKKHIISALNLFDHNNESVPNQTNDRVDKKHPRDLSKFSSLSEAESASSSEDATDSSSNSGKEEDTISSHSEEMESAYTSSSSSEESNESINSQNEEMLSSSETRVKSVSLLEGITTFENENILESPQVLKEHIGKKVTELNENKEAVNEFREKIVNKITEFLKENHENLDSEIFHNFEKIIDQQFTLLASSLPTVIPVPNDTESVLHHDEIDEELENLAKFINEALEEFGAYSEEFQEILQSTIPTESFKELVHERLTDPESHLPEFRKMILNMKEAFDLDRIDDQTSLENSILSESKDLINEIVNSIPSELIDKDVQDKVSAMLYRIDTTPDIFAVEITQLAIKNKEAPESLDTIILMTMFYITQLNIDRHISSYESNQYLGILNANPWLDERLGTNIALGELLKKVKSQM